MAGTDPTLWGAGQLQIPGPQGDPGPAGPPPTIVIGNVQPGITADATLTEVSPGVYELDLVLPRGLQGNTGSTGATGPQGPQGPAGIVASVVSGNAIFVDATDPGNPVVNLDTATRDLIAEKISSVVGGQGIEVDVTDPINIEVSLDTTTQDILSDSNLSVVTIVEGDGVIVTDTDVDPLNDGSWKRPIVGVHPAFAPTQGAIHTASVDPTSSDIADGEYMVWHNTAANETKLWANLGGTLLSVGLT